MNRKLILVLSLFVLFSFLYVEFRKVEGNSCNDCTVCSIDIEWDYTTIQEATNAEIHDVAVINVTLSVHEVYESQNIDIEVVVRNEGDFTERFNVTTYANQTSNVIAIDTYLVTSLGSPDQITIPFVWNTTEVAPGNYTITAEASVLDGETDIADNIKTSNSVWIKADNTAPVIGVPVQDPPGNIVWVTAYSVDISVNVTDFGSGVHTVILSWRVENWTAYTVYENRTMVHSTGDTYTWYIPIYRSGAWISYRIIAYDGAGNQAVRDHGGLYYVYHVIPEFPSFLIIPLFMITTLLAAIAYKRNHS